MSSVEAVDLEDPTTSCQLIADYPEENAKMAVGLFDGLIKSCGGEFDTDACYDYDPSTDSWTTGVSMLYERDTPRASFIDGVWLISGDGSDDDDFRYNTETWNGSEFEDGLLLPLVEPMFNHCQLTVNSTHIFFADGYYSHLAYLLDWTEQSWTLLPPMRVERTFPSCGLINNPENGPEAVIVEDGVSEIFNFNDMSWRAGPVLTPFDQAGFAQLGGDTFVLVGGRSSALSTLNTIYVFDNLNYEWIEKSQRLQTTRENYPGVVAVPDDFVTCE